MARNTKGLRSKSQAQSTIEYLLLVAVTILAIFFFIKPGGYFQETYVNITEDQSESLGDMSNRIFR